MSAKLAMLVYTSDLPPHLKETAAVLAHFANEDGARIFPSVGRVAWLIGKTARQVRDDLTALCARGVLVAVTPRTGGRGRTTHYQLNPSALPARPPWRPKYGRPIDNRNPEAHFRVSVDETRKPTSVYQQLKAEAERTKGGSWRHKRRKFETPKEEVHFLRSSRDQLVEGSEEGARAPAALCLSHTPEKQKEEEDRTHATFVRMKQAADTVAARCSTKGELKSIVRQTEPNDVDDQLVEAAVSMAWIGATARRER